MNSEIEVKRVKTEEEKYRFIKFPWKIYKGDKNWVPPLIFDVRRNLTNTINPFFKHAEAALFLAYKNKELVGRIAAIVNYNHNSFHNDKVGFFGYFECIDNYKVANALFQAAADYLKSKGMEVIRGPINLSTNDEVGLLIKGFDSPPVLLMTYNPSYYIELIHNFGFTKAKDLYAYHVGESILSNKEVLDKLKRVSEIVKKRDKITFRTLRMKELVSELNKIKEVYNNAWKYNWGFVPMTDEEFEFVAHTLRPLADPDLVYFAEYEGRPVGFSMALPDYNQVFIKMNGRLFPFGIFKLLKYRKKIDGIRLITMGIIHEFQKKGIEAVFIKDTIETCYRKGIKHAEISWVLEDNIPMVQTAVNLDAELYKIYRIYDRVI
ncbi:MAG: hypothetical protein N2490_00820 [Ignavibacteria bacterium]|nr:hypothetical protein [Ignavibacteria bacterium]